MAIVDGSSLQTQWGSINKGGDTQEQEQQPVEMMGSSLTKPEARMPRGDDGQRHSRPAP